MKARLFDRDLLGVRADTAAKYTIPRRELGVLGCGKYCASELEAEDERWFDQRAIVLVFAPRLT